MKVTKLIQRGTELLEGQSIYLDEKSKSCKIPIFIMPF